MVPMDSDRALPATPPPIGLAALFTKFLGFGAFAFGGPVAQIAMIRQALVEEERWIDRPRFNRLLAVLQVLPGPEAHELCVHLGMMARGRLGGLLAGLGFMLPGFLLMLLAAWLYVGFVAAEADLAGVLLGIQVAVLAIILRAVVRIGEHILEDHLLWAIAIAALVGTLAGVPFWIALAAGGAAYALAHRPWLVALVLLGAVALAALTLLMPFGGTAASAPGAEAATPAALFLAGLKGGLLTFGGAYTAIPYVRADTVGRGWIEDATFLDGIAVSGVLPAPLVIFATFVGYVAGGLSGALAITAGMFLPAFACSMIFYERLEQIVQHPALHRLLSGVAAAVVGIIGATLVQLTVSLGPRIAQPLVATALFALALAAVWWLSAKWVTPAVLALGGMTGWLFVT